MDYNSSPQSSQCLDKIIACNRAIYNHAISYFVLLKNIYLLLMIPIVNMLFPTVHFQNSSSNATYVSFKTLSG